MMKHRTKTALLLAAATALAPLSSAAAQIPLTALAAETEAVAALPDWIPEDYYSAVEFRNSYGATHIGSGLICLVFPEVAEPADADIPVSEMRYALSATNGIAQCLKDQTYSVEDGGLGLRVAVYQPQRQGELNVTHTDTWVKSSDGTGVGSQTYSFAVDETDPELHTLELRELDLYGWLPDCRAEYDAFVKEHGLVSVHDNYAVLCMNSAVGTAYEWREASSDYSSVFAYRTTSSCSTVSGNPVAGGSAYDIAVYQAIEDGAAKIEWEYGSFLTDGKVTKTLTADCMVTDGARNILLPHMMRIEFTDAASGFRANVPTVWDPITLSPSAALVNLAEGEDIHMALDIAPLAADCNPFIWDCAGLEGCKVDIDVAESALPEDYHLADGAYKKVTEYPNGARNVEFRIQYGEAVEGDVNGDGEFSIADAVLFSKWLLGMTDAQLVNWRTADFTRDGKLNAADFSLMKRELMRKNAFENALFIIDRENSWVNYQETTAYTSEMLRESPEIISLLEKINVKKDVLAHTDTISWEFRVMDYGDDALSLPVTDAAGNIGRLKLCSFGADTCVLDDPDVLALVKLLNEKRIFGPAGCFDFDESAVRSAPVAVTIEQTGGIAGVRNLWRIFSKNGVYTASVTDKKTGGENPTKSTELTEEMFDSFMSQDFTQYYNQKDGNAGSWDGFHYYTVYTYEGGITRASHADVTELRFGLEELIYGVPLSPLL